MPLTTERPGVFRGRALYLSNWYVVDPAAPDGAETTEIRWRAAHARTNALSARGVVWTVVPWLAFLAASGVTIWLTYTVATIAPFAGLIGVLGAIAAIAVGLAVSSALAPDQPETAGVDRIDGLVARWADDETAPEDLWALQQAIDRLRVVRNMMGYPAEPYPDDAPWSLDKVITSTLLAEDATQFAELSAIAGRVGFPDLERLNREIRD